MVVNFWVDNTFIRYIVEFAPKNNQSMSKAKEELKKGVRGGFFKEVSLWIKTWMVEYEIFY